MIFWRPTLRSVQCVIGRKRAEYARGFRDSMHDKTCREMMLDIINAYERLAESAAKYADH